MAKTKEIPKKIEIQQNNGFCTPDNCFMNEIVKDNDVLQCRRCERFVHYACTELPAYQIQLCLQYKSRRFECAKCVTVTPILLEKIKTSTERVRKDKATNTDKVNNGEQQGDKSTNARLDRLEKKIEKLLDKEDVAKKKKQRTYAETTKEELKKQEVTMKQQTYASITELKETRDETLEEQRTSDKDYVEEFVSNQMGLKVHIVSAERIGARKNEMFRTKRWRPLKVVLRNEEEKRQILASVHKLKKIITDLRVTDDFSKKERETIKEWHRNAKEKTKLQKDGSQIKPGKSKPPMQDENKCRNSTTLYSSNTFNYFNSQPPTLIDYLRPRPPQPAEPQQPPQQPPQPPRV
ncbi:uncharacterized protein DDB_G0284459-like [Clytia hemisphaerica]|uniref:uncharacterized protein DDB_G0284459-like n=1 Tax=Clytia hemisphaerica TaxID=252671 RepID=UPI0034D7B95C